jgi:acetyl esterase/lipase
MRLAPLVVLLLAGPAAAQVPYDRTEDVIYGRKYGTALTLDVFTPKGTRNGAAVIFAVSGGWFSAHELVPVAATLGRPLVQRGYVLFAVVHGSQPKYTIPEVLDDMHRAARFVRANAKKYGIDPDRIGITGGSAGGHLSLMQGTAPKPGDPDAADPVERVSSKVAAVACFYPPTDFFNWSAEGDMAKPGQGRLGPFRAPFDFHTFDEKRRVFEPVTDPAKRAEVFRAISPITHVTKESAPALIVHGDKDDLVPIYQAERMVARYKEAGVPAELVVKPGAGHGWADQAKDVERFADWFDRHMPAKK